MISVEVVELGKERRQCLIAILLFALTDWEN